MDYPRLRSAPISEVLLDFRVVLDTNTSISQLIDFSTTVRDEYPEVQPIFHHQFEFQLSPSSEPQSSRQSEIGRLCWNVERSRAVQVTTPEDRVGAFIINWTQKYETFEALVNVARGLWGIYYSVVSPLEITRCALRYINKVDVPKDTPLDNILRTKPVVGGDPSRSIERFFSQLVLPYSGGRHSVITEHLGPGDSERARVLIFDIEVSSEGMFSPCLLYTSPSPRDGLLSRMPSSA